MIIAVTGHRPHKLNNEYEGKGVFSTAIKQKMRDTLLSFEEPTAISGMAIGVDMLFAEIALDLKVDLICAIPFEGQEKKWPKGSQDRYNNILKNATQKVVVSPGGYAAWKMDARNRWMVDNSDMVLAFWDGTGGGTANCVRYARKMGKKIKVFNPIDLI